MQDISSATQFLEHDCGMPNKISNAIWIAAFACVVLGAVFEIQRASEHQKQKEPPREYLSQKTDTQKNDTKHRSNGVAAIQIECDPTAQQNIQMTMETRVIYRGL